MARLPGADTLSPPRIHKLKKKKAYIGNDSACHICIPDEACARRQAMIYPGKHIIFQAFLARLLLMLFPLSQRTG